MEEEQEEEYSGVSPQHIPLYSKIEHEYNIYEFENEDYFFIGLTNTKSQLLIQYDFEDKNFVFLIKQNLIIVEVCKFTTSKEFNSLTNYLINNKQYVSNES